MKKTIFAIILTITFGCATAQKVSHSSGYYPDDSIQFKIDTSNVPAGHSVYVSINSWNTSRAFQRYSEPFLLRNRNYSPNSWENTNFTRGPFWFGSGSGLIDTTYTHGLVRKTNRVQVLLIRNSDQKVIKDSVYHIGVGIPYQPEIAEVFLDVDSIDILGDNGIMVPGIGMQNPDDPSDWIWNFEMSSDFDFLDRDMYEVKCNYQILINNKIVFYQDAGLRISGNSSVYLMNKTLAVVARKEYGLNGNGPKMITTNAIEGRTVSYKWNKIRTVHNFCSIFGANELGLDLVRGLGLGDSPYRISKLNLNDSYWNLNYLQPKMNQYALSRMFGVNSDSVTYAKPVHKAWYLPLGLWSDSVTNLALTYYGFMKIQHGTSEMIIPTVLPEEGSEFPRLSEMGKSLIRTHLFSTGDQMDTLRKLLDLKQFYKYFSLLAYSGNDDVIQNNSNLGIIPRGKIFPIATDFDGIGRVSGNYFDYIKDKANDTTVWQSIIELIYNSPTAVQELMRTHQDLLNVQFNDMKTDSLLLKIESDQAPYFPEHYDAWGPINSGCFSTTGQGMGQLRQFFNGRNDISLMQMTQYFQSDSNYTVADAKTVSMDFSNVQGDTTAWIQVNSVLKKKNWSGRYLPMPTIKVTIPNGYYVAEFPDSSGMFELYVTNDQTLTLMKHHQILPVELSFFGCGIENGLPTLNWQTASELQNSYFEVQKSNDGISFITIGRVLGAGNSNQRIDYRFLDTTRTAGSSAYYRLKQVNIDGSFKLSDICIVLMHIQIPSVEEVLIFPNPTNGIITVHNVIGMVVVIDLLGQQLFSQKIDKSNNLISLESFPTGMYYLKIELSNGADFVKQIVKLK